MSTGLIRLPSMPTEVKIGEDWLLTRDDLVKRAAGLIVENEIGFAVASELLQAVTKTSGALEKFRKQYAEPFSQAAKAIKQMADDARDPLEQVKTRLNGLISAYAETQRKIELAERRKAEEDARALAEKQVAEQEEASELFGTEVSQEVTVVVQPVYVAPRAVNSAVRIKKSVVWNCTDESLVPVAFKSLDDRKVNAYMRDHKADIEAALDKDETWTFAPGITLKFETTAASR